MRQIGRMKLLGGQGMNHAPDGCKGNVLRQAGRESEACSGGGKEAHEE
jgi:hypothetical protein